MLLLMLFMPLSVHSWSLFSSVKKLYYSEMPPVLDESCNFTRTDALHCLSDYVDVAPKDGGITPKEARLAIKRYSTGPIRALFWGLGTKEIWKACDADHNGVITPKDWIATRHTCMPAKKNMCSLEWFCKRAKKFVAKKSPLPPRVVKGQH